MNRVHSVCPNRSIEAIRRLETRRKSFGLGRLARANRDEPAALDKPARGDIRCSDASKEGAPFDIDQHERDGLCRDASSPVASADPIPNPVHAVEREARHRADDLLVTHNCSDEHPRIG